MAIIHKPLSASEFYSKSHKATTLSSCQVKGYSWPRVETTFGNKSAVIAMCDDINDAKFIEYIYNNAEYFYERLKKLEDMEKACEEAQND